MDRKPPPWRCVCCVVLTPVLLLCSRVCNEWSTKNVRVCFVLVKTFVDVQMVFTSWLMDEGPLAPASSLTTVKVCVFPG